jgi:hypothetical protein
MCPGGGLHLLSPGEVVTNGLVAQSGSGLRTIPGLSSMNWKILKPFAKFGRKWNLKVSSKCLAFGGQTQKKGSCAAYD